VVYPGAPEPTDFVEVDAGNALVCQIDASGFSATPHPVASWTFVREIIDLGDEADVEALDHWLNGLAHADRTIVRLGLTGQLSLAAHARLSAVLELHAERLGALDRWDAEWNLVVLADELDLDRLSLSGFAAEAMVELRAQAARTGSDGDRIANDALALLFRLGTAS